MSSFWERVFEDEPAPQAAPTPQTVAPGSWWQTEKQRWEQSHQSHVQQQVPSQQHLQQTPEGSVAPDPAWENCPRCDSENYVKMPREAGGDFARGEYKWCYDCRYPGVDASGTVTTKSVNRTRGKGRSYGEPGVGSWAGSAGEAAVIGRIDE